MTPHFFPFLSLFLSSTAIMAATTEEKKQSKQPNILFCIADDAGHMSAYGMAGRNTPAFDK